MRNYLYALVAVTVLSVALFSSAGTRPALAAADAHNQVAWGETAYFHDGTETVSNSNGHDLLIDSTNNVFADSAAAAEASAVYKSMKFRSSGGGGKGRALVL